MNTPCDVFCIGNAVADVLARPVDGLAPPGTSQRLEDAVLGPGGNGINTGIALARLGVVVRVAAAIGDDRLGQVIREALHAERVDDSALVTLAGTKTSVSIVLVQTSAERRLLHFRGANTLFSDQYVDWSLAAGARVCLYASAFALPAFDGEPLERTFARARQMGCLTAINVCWDVQGR